jgi:hypothetical protein
VLKTEDGTDNECDDDDDDIVDNGDMNFDIDFVSHCCFLAVLKTEGGNEDECDDDDDDMDDNGDMNC